MKTRAVVKSLALPLFAFLMLGIYTGCDSITSGDVDASTTESLAKPQARLVSLGSGDLQDPSRIPIYVINGSSRRVAKYAELSLEQQRMIDASLKMLRNPASYPQSRNIDLTIGDTGAAAIGCGINSTKSEPLQVGCWAGDTVCYVSLGEDGVDAGCHKKSDD